MDPEDVFGWRVSELVPRPVPFRFRLLDPEERGWRGRAAIRFWVMGYPIRTAWRFALSEDPEWSDYLRDEHGAQVEDWQLPGTVLSRRLMAVAEPDMLTSVHQNDS